MPNYYIGYRNFLNLLNKKLSSKTSYGIQKFNSSGKYINQFVDQYRTQDYKTYNETLNPIILEDISFIPLQNYVKHIYTGLYYRKEPYEYETGSYNLPKITGNLITGDINYIDYQAASYIKNSNDPYYDSQMPESGEKHILHLNLNLYGFEEDAIEDCDIELNAMVLKTGFFQQIPKDPTILNLKINDINPTYSITDSVNDYIQQKRILKSSEANNFISYNPSFNSFNSDTFSNNTTVIEKYKYIKNTITISNPFFSNNKNIALPCLFQYKSTNSNLTYNLGEYKFLIFDSSNNYLQSGNYITGTQTGFLYFLAPGTYTTIVSGNENDFLYTENSLSGKNQNIHLLSMSVDFVTGEKLQEIYIENQDKIWASYLLGQAELIPGSGYNSLNYQDPVSFAIDFERSLSGQVDSPFLFYREETGVYENLCTPEIIVFSGKSAACTREFCVFCTDAGKRYQGGETYIDIAIKYLPRASIEYLNFFESPNPNNYRVALDQQLASLCCECKEYGCSDSEVDKIFTNLNFAKTATSGDKIYSGVFFLDDSSPSTINLKYNLNYYSGQIAVNSFYDGDKITFKQYPFDFEKVYQRLYGSAPAIKEYVTEFIFSNSSIGNNYFSGKQDLINKINIKLASSGLYSWKPLKYKNIPEFEYGPLLTGIDGGIDDDGNNIINIISLRSGKFGSHEIKLNLQPRLQIYNYLVPKIIRMEVSDNYIDWTGIVTSENLQPINTYIKSPNNTVGNIRYDEIENTKYTITKEIPTSSELEYKEEKEIDIEDLIKNLASGNTGANFIKGSTICVPSPTGSGIVCGTGFYDFNKIDFSCKGQPEISGDPQETGKGGTEKEGGKNEDSQVLTEEVDRFRISYYDYLS